MRTVIPKNIVTIPEHATVVYSGEIFSVHAWQQEMYDGSTETFEMVRRPDSVKALCIVDDKIIVLESEQPLLQPYLDLPGGRHDNPNEDELQAIQREVLEETGLTFKNWKLIDAYQPEAKVDRIYYSFVATDPKPADSVNLDAGEKITIKYASFEELQGMRFGVNNRYHPLLYFPDCRSIDNLQKLPEFKED